MRRRIIVIALVLVVIAAFSAAVFAQAKTTVKKPAKGPIAVIGDKTVNLGEVLEGQDYEHTFVITNRGTEELQILSVRPG
jgi:hypothetical protein